VTTANSIAKSFAQPRCKSNFRQTKAQKLAGGQSLISPFESKQVSRNVKDEIELIDLENIHTH